MTARHIDQAVAILKRSYPGQPMPASTEAVYAKSLEDFRPAEILDAVSVAVACEPRLPSIARLREIVFDRRLALASPHEAWEAALAYAHRRRATIKCFHCAGFGTAVGGEEPCERCRGVGEIAEPAAPLDPLAKRALAIVGGGVALRTTERLDVLRAQFLKAYAEFRTAEIRAANLESLGVLPLAARHLSIAAGE